MLSAIAEFNHRPRSAAQALASRRTNTIEPLFALISGDSVSPLL